MKERILQYLARIDGLLEANDDKTDWALLNKEHLTQIQFFQHERMAHLLTTLGVAILFFISIMLVMAYPGYATAGLCILLLCLLVPYIMHYFLLENGVQKMYRQFDRIWQKIQQLQE